jgi:peptidoglycan/LPS O-acetylase OafA/YrhL
MFVYQKLTFHEANAIGADVTNPQWASQTIPSLNGFRAISVLLVVLAHSGFGTIVPGALGVTIFFFLSGYLITTLMLAESERSGNIAIRNFYTRRIFRLAPPLLITLTIAYGLTYFGLLPGRITLEGLAAQVLYFANYYALFFDPSAQTTPAGTGVLWSLAVEEHFYIFFPLLMAVFVSVAWRPRAIGILLVATCLVILAWRIYLVRSPDFFSDRTYLASETRIDSIIYGCLMAFLINPLRAPHLAEKMSLTQWTLFSIGTGFLLLSLFYRNPVFRETFRYSLQGIALFPLFYFAIRFHDNALFRHLNSAWAIRIGTYSYAIYLIHQIIIFAIDKNVPFTRNNPFFIFPATLVISIAFAALIDRFVDQYFKRLRRKHRSAERSSIPHGPDIRKPLSESAAPTQNCAA